MLGASTSKANSYIRQCITADLAAGKDDQTRK